MCLKKPSGGEGGFLDMVRTAVLSARLHAPSLAPYVLYMLEKHDKFDHNDTLVRWLTARGARVVPRALSFWSSMEGSQRPAIMLRRTGLCKMDIPHVASSLAGELRGRGLRSDTILVTDADVLFSREVAVPQFERSAHPLGIAASIEVFHGGCNLNSGVLFVNVSAFLSHWPQMLTLAKAKRFRYPVADQSWLHDYACGGGGGCRWQRAAPGVPGYCRGPSASGRGSLGFHLIDPQNYGARAFMHPPLPCELVSDDPKDCARRRPPPSFAPSIWHWAGYKPNDVQCWLRAMRSGKWPERAWRNAAPPHAALPQQSSCTRRQCHWKPILGTPCRFYAALAPLIKRNPCYLRTYVHLLAEHKRLLHMARGLAS